MHTSYELARQAWLPAPALHVQSPEYNNHAGNEGRHRCKKMSKTKHCDNPLCEMPMARKDYGKWVLVLFEGGISEIKERGESEGEKEGPIAIDGVTGKRLDSIGGHKRKIRVCKQCWDDYNDEMEAKGKDTGVFGHAEGKASTFLDKIFEYYDKHPDKLRKKILRT